MSSGSDRRRSQTAERALLDRAIAGLRGAGDDPSLRGEEDAQRLARLAGALRERFELYGEQSDIDAAIAASMQAAALPIAPSIRHARARQAAALMRVKARASRRRADAAALVTFTAERERDSEGTRAGDWADELRAALLDRRALVGPATAEGAADLDAAIRAARRAVAPGAGDVDRRRRLSALSWLLSFRFDATASLDDLGEAIDAARRAAHGAAAAAVPCRETEGATADRAAREPSPRAVALARLGRLLWMRRELLGDAAEPSTVIEGRETAEAALALEPSGPLASDLLLLLASFDDALPDTGSAEARDDRVLAHLEHAIELAPRAWPRLPEALARQAATLARRARLERQLGDLDRAIRHGDEALAAAAERGLARSPYEVGLADLLRRRHGETGARRDRDRAIEHYRNATATETSPVALLRASIDWASWAVARHAFSEAVEAYRIAIAASERLDEPLLARELNGRSLADAGALANAAAFALAREGLLDEAAECIERGRALVVADALRRSAPARAIERDASIGANPARADGDRAGSAFSMKEIRAAARPASLIYVLATADGGLALLVDERPAPAALWLPELTTSALAEQVTAWRAAASGPSSEFAATIDRLTGWLWKVLMGAVVTELERTRAEQAVLVPAGQLGVLPLHAAWTSGPRSGSGRTYALDRVPIRIAPSARVLSTGRELAARAGDGRTLVLEAGGPGTPAARALATLPDVEVVELGYLDEPVGAAAALIDAGAAGVITMLWPLPDPDLALLHLRLYECWRADRLAPVLALRAAEQWLRDTTIDEKLGYLARLAGSPDPLALAAQTLHDSLELVAETDERPHETPYHWAALQFHGA